MPKEPRDHKRPSAVTGNAVRIAGTGEERETTYGQPAKARVEKPAAERRWKE